MSGAQCPAGYTYLKHGNNYDFMNQNLETPGTHTVHWYKGTTEFAKAKHICDNLSECSGFLLEPNNEADNKSQILMRKWAPNSSGKAFYYDPKARYEWCVKDESNVIKHDQVSLFKM